MTNLILNEAINLVDDDLISDAYSNSRKHLSVYKYIAVAAALVIILTAVALGTRDERKPDVENTTTSADIPHNSFYIDNLSDAGFGYKYCYADKSMSGNVGIANADGSILLNPAYVTVHAVSQDRFIARKFVEQSAHSALVNENGKEIIAFFRGEIRRINNTSDGAEPVLSVEPFGEKAYFADLNGQKITDFEFNGTGFTETGLIYGYTDTAYYIFDDFCNLLCMVNEGETEVVYALNSKYNLLVKNHGNRFRYGVEKADGTEIISCDYDEINVISDDCIVARIGEAQSNSPDDIVRIFDENGTQLSTDGEFNSVAFNESGYGIACKLEYGVIELEMKFWLVNKDGKKVSEIYDNIKINENNEFIGIKNGIEEKIEISG